MNTNGEQTLGGNIELGTEIFPGTALTAGADATYPIGGELGVDFKVGIRNGAGPLPTGDPTGLGTGPQEYQLDRALDGVFNSFVAARGPVQGSQEFPAFIQEALASGFQEAKSNLPDALSPGANYARGVAIDKLEGALNTLLETVPVDVRDDARTEILTERAGMAAESMPDSPDNQSRYPQSRSQAEGVGFPCARVTGLFCLSTAALLDATVTACKGKGSDEPAALRELLVHVHDNDVLLGDAGLESYWVMAALLARGADGVFAAHGGRKLTGGKRCLVLERPARPAWMTPEQHAGVPKTIRVRCVEIRHAGKIRTLLSALVDAKGCSAKTLRALYRRRWAAELDFRSLKTTLGMDVLRCKSADMVLKEIWVHLLAYNLIRVVMAEAAASAGREPRELSFKHTLQLWGASRALGGALDESRTAALLGLIAGRRVGNRPGRSEPRVTRRRPKPHRLMLRPRLALKIEMYRAGKC